MMLALLCLVFMMIVGGGIFFAIVWMNDHPDVMESALMFPVYRLWWYVTSRDPVTRYCARHIALMARTLWDSETYDLNDKPFGISGDLEYNHYQNRYEDYIKITYHDDDVFEHHYKKGVLRFNRGLWILELAEEYRCLFNPVRYYSDCEKKKRFQRID